MSLISQGKEILFAAPAAVTGSNQEVIAAVTGKTIVVLGFVLSCSANGSLQFVTDTGGTPVAKSGAIDIAANGDLMVGYGGVPVLAGDSGKNLGFTTGGAETISGVIAYYLAE